MLDPQTIENIAKIIEFFNQCLPFVDNAYNKIVNKKFKRNRTKKAKIIIYV